MWTAIRNSYWWSDPSKCTSWVDRGSLNTLVPDARTEVASVQDGVDFVARELGVQAETLKVSPRAVESTGTKVILDHDWWHIQTASGAYVGVVYR